MPVPASIDIPTIAKLAPPQWNDLLAFTGQVIGGADGSALDEAAVAQVYERVHALPDVPAEEAYSFGLRPLMAGVEIVLQDREVRQNAVNFAATHAYTRWEIISHNDETHTRFRVGDLQTSEFEEPLYPAVVAANKLVPTDWRVLADVLTIDIHDRRCHNYERAGRDLGMFRPLPPQSQFENVLFGLPTTTRVSENGMRAAFAMVQTALHKLYEHGGGTIKKLPSDVPDLPLTEAIQYIGRLEEGLGKLSLRGATFRLDQFPDVLKKCVGVDKSGQLEFVTKHQKAIKQQPRPVLEARLSDATYRCPAVFADKLIPTVVDMAIEATGLIHDKIAPTQKTSPRVLQFLAKLLHHK